TTAIVGDEIARLRATWTAADATAQGGLVERLLTAETIAGLDRFERVQLEDVLTVCRQSRTLSDAGRRLFTVSRERRTTANDADRLRKSLARFDLTWPDVRGAD